MDNLTTAVHREKMASHPHLTMVGGTRDYPHERQYGQSLNLCQRQQRYPIWCQDTRVGDCICTSVNAQRWGKVSRFILIRPEDSKAGRTYSSKSWRASSYNIKVVELPSCSRCTISSKQDWHKSDLWLFSMMWKSFCVINRLACALYKHRNGRRSDPRSGVSISF